MKLKGTPHNFKTIIKAIFHDVKQQEAKGELATYIPELAHVNPEKFGVHISTIHNEHFGIGDYDDMFSIQSISKLLSLCMAYHILGETIWNRLGVEPSGTPFNSLIQLEADKGIPRNPFINAGAIVIADILCSHLKNPKAEFLDFVRTISNNSEINYNTVISKSEQSVGHRNIALCHFIKSYDNIKNDPYEVLDFYFDMCSLEMSCKDLSQLLLFLANHGRRIITDTQVLTKSQAKRINALMQTCGFYDESGEFAFKVGIPGKSGVGGGIIAIHPNQYAIAVWSPLLNAKGNSYKGMRFLETFTTQTEHSIF